MFEISIKTHFSAAHHLKGYQGSCSMPHGHNWDVEVFVRGRELDSTGIVMDFRKLKGVVREILADLDHVDLSEMEVFKDANPSSENVARLLYERACAEIDGADVKVHRVCVGETPESRACYWDDARA